MASTSNKLSTFVLVDNGKIISPVMTTIREYGRWMQIVFDEYTSNYELYCKKITDGKSLLTYHPGSKIGRYFDANTFNDSKYHSWYLYQSNSAVTHLASLRLAELRDCVPIQTDADTRINMLRLYSVDQVELYIRNNIDKNFLITELMHQPKQIVLQKVDLSLMQMPKPTPRKSLFDKIKEKQAQIPINNAEDEKQAEVEEKPKKRGRKKAVEEPKEEPKQEVKPKTKPKKTKAKPKQLTLAQIEKELGYKIKIVPEKEDN